MQSLPGFRDFYPGDFLRREYLLARWREVALRYGFQEYDAPVLESAELYEKKNSGGEILEQLYRFEDRGGRDVCLRPEMTPTLARMVAARAPQLKKPVKWFSIASFFRYERQQKGRLREFLQLNCDILGDASAAADAELLALTIDILRALGFSEGDFVLRLSDRRPWLEFLEKRSVDVSRVAEFLGVVDKMERAPEESTREALSGFGVSLEEVRDFLASGGHGAFEPLLTELGARGLAGFVEPDLTIVRGLAYYTGTVFEVFDRAKNFRAIAGGGRYDNLLRSLSDGSADLPAIGMGMGDVVLDHFVQSHAGASGLREEWIASHTGCDVYVVIAAEERRKEALGLVQLLREAGRSVEFPFSATKVGKQFQSAESSGAVYAVLVGAEWPEVKIKTLSSREERVCSKDALAEWAKTAQF